MSKTCKGCGVILQNEDKEALGYTPSMEKEYCQRCFRLTHYNDVMISMQQGIDNDALLEKVNALDALVLWVVDVVDFESSIIKGINRHLIGKDIVLICTKSDLLPRDVNPNKIANFILHRLKVNGIHVKGVVMCPNLHKQDEESVASIEAAMDHFRAGRDVVLLGNANAGKSTLLNALLQKQALTTSIHPGTTLDINPILYNDYTLYDTPGIVNKKSLLTYVPEDQLKDAIFFKQLNPKKYQLKDNQSLAIGGYVRLDLKACEQVSVVCYFSESLTIHRGKMEQADELWERHLGEMLSPTIDSNYKDMKKYTTTKNIKKMDIVIAGLGWFCIQGEVKDIHVYVNKNVDVLFREAMI
ncbi:ribosome biogenesis GTPase YqeH [Breznakia sp. PF5-3]|uniref:ribosome biogenesis GTPase YqeH n=1 Tax=unclassified Breznakia TaxID=2623764 RepID=UPI0024051F3C|nr:MULTISPECIES: ribosome biogenesis GTPase YqeH [unclassified Breznakia]MDF9824076.1 ribosome biogenesis GTPase YqeH [Breznakia sp. PM6-1]MDF9834858.1 ribosome biogenesis GTPase YqeH [Breznakia sp. PF5-3]MDF9837120.1 ribosome biogenesis GTPase YqeH [Breznakia sp. PFB2-8]MDF9859045.1 ribosome biogenesis GTPase YqeH [Breznakia sp. PH5-24]